MVLFYFMVLNPLRANLLVSITKHYPLPDAARAIILNHATIIDQCNLESLDALGDTYISLQNPAMAAIMYGNAMHCSPRNSLMRFKYGEALLMLNFIEGKNYLTEAALLEPNNPYYQAEIKRVTAFQ